MTPTAVCMLIVRVIGLILILWRAEAVVTYPVAWADWIHLAFFVRTTDLLANIWMNASGSHYYLPDLVVIGQFALGLYMLLGGKRVVRLLLRRLPGISGHCSRCGYDIRGLEGGRCPECGAKVPERQ